MASPDSLRVAIESLHQAIADHDDPAAKATLTTCLAQMLKVQQNDYQQAQQLSSNPRAQVMQQMAGAQ